MQPVPISQAVERFSERSTGPRALLSLASAGANSEASSDGLELLPSAAIVFALGAWEACCEEMLRAAAVAVTGAARKPSDLPKAVQQTITTKVGEPGEPWEDVLARLHGNWHNVAIRHLASALEYRFRHWNTPSGEQVDRLAQQVAGMNPISPKWPSQNGHPGADLLDEAIAKRGRAVHLSQTEMDVEYAQGILELLDGIAAATATAISRHIGHLPPA